MKDRIYISKNSSNTIASGGSVVIDGITLSLSNINEYDVRTIAEEVEVPVKGVKIAGTELTPDSEGKVDVPIASNNNAGLFLTTGSGGINIGSSGNAVVYSASDNLIEEKTNQYRPVVPNNLDKAVMEGLGNNSLSWTSAYKTAAQTTIGINTEQLVFTMADGTEVTHNIKISA